MEYILWTLTLSLINVVFLLLILSLPLFKHFYIFYLCIIVAKYIIFFLQEALAQISEYSEAGITVRGTYVPVGKSPPEGERKLYLAIESTSDIAVSKAKAEITRLIKEELLKLQTAGHHSFNKARYKVL